jgi:hypothetical protein
MRSLTLPRADAEGVALPHTGQEPPPVELVLDKYLGPTGIAPEGYEIEHMLAAHYSAKYPGIPIAINIIDGAEYPQGKRDVIEEAKSFTAAAAAQGVVLPYFAGLFTDGTTYCLVFKEPGQAITHN